MKYVCTKCLKLFPERFMVRMPFNSDEEYWCETCHKFWAEDNPYRGTSKKSAKEKIK